MRPQTVNGTMYYLFPTRDEARSYSWLFGRKLVQVGRMFGYKEAGQ